MIQDELQMFKDWWLKNRPFTIPSVTSVINDGNIHGVVLYRAECWQVQLFILEPFIIIPEHLHPNVDSYEVFLSGDIEFTLNGVIKTPRSLETSFTGSSIYNNWDIRVLPNAWHNASSSYEGGSFLSIQRWLNGTVPSNVGSDWIHKVNETRRNYSADS